MQAALPDAGRYTEGSDGGRLRVGATVPGDCDDGALCTQTAGCVPRYSSGQAIDQLVLSPSVE